MRLLLKPFHWLYIIWAFALFIALMIPVFIWSVLVSPFGRISGGNLIYRACMLWADIWYFLVAIWHKNIYEQPLQKGISYIFVSNHTSYMDIPAIVKSFRVPLRPLAKAETAKVPIFGYIYKNVIVSVERTSPENRAKSVILLKSTIQKGVSVLVFPEGTFNETSNPLKDFYDGAFRIAIETGTPIKPVIMLDNFHRLHYSSIFSLTPGRSRTVFLKEVPTDGYTLDDVKQLKEHVYRLMESKLIEYKAPWIKD